MGAIREQGADSLSTTKRQILERLGLRPQTVSDLARGLGIQKSAVHKHLQRLVADGAITRRPSSRWVYYHVRSQNIPLEPSGIDG